MRMILSVALAGLLLAGAVFAQDKPKLAEPAKDDIDGLLTSITKTLTEIGETLGKINSDKAAKEAIPALEKLSVLKGDLAARAQKVAKPTGDEEKALKTKYEAELTVATKKIMSEVERLKGQPYGRAVLDALMKPKPKSAEKPKEQ